MAAALIAMVGVALASAGCEDARDTTMKSISSAKACEIQKSGKQPTEDECEELCDDSSVDECRLSGMSAVDPCAEGTPATLSQGLMCIDKYTKPANPFSSGTTQEGRRPEGFEPRTTVARGDLGSYFASCYELEAASIDAFDRLTRELKAFGAPADLIARSEGARRDEIRHARWTAALAKKYGHPNVTPVPPAPLHVRSLFEMALENAIEGVVRETLGAANALYRAAKIPDPQAAKVMKRIAEDELEHADLAWSIATFAIPQLTDSERTEISTAIHRELTQLRASAFTDESLHQAAGLPTPQVMNTFITTLHSLLSEEELAA